MTETEEMRRVMADIGNETDEIFRRASDIASRLVGTCQVAGISTIDAATNTGRLPPLLPAGKQ